MTALIALITGANKGIGLETARQLGGRGMTVLIGSRDARRGRAAEAALRAEDIDAHFVELDVTGEASARKAADWVDARFGRLDVLVNNAGIAVRGGPPSATSLDAMREVFETNVYGVITVTNAMLPLLRRAPSARIVNVSSELGSVTFMSDRSGPAWQMPASISYPASKAALNMVTAMYAKELAGTPIKVNAANPGYCATDLNGHSGFRAAAEGASVSVHLATLPDDGPTGTLWGHIWGAPDSPASGELRFLSRTAAADSRPPPPLSAG
ncbi:MAG TPA: SDR family oxidoreductase [Trebonia sp.]|nr:SDR family oxidoreductase [Trebonia sp.]